MAAVGRWVLVGFVAAQWTGLIWVGLLGVSKAVQSTKRARRSNITVARGKCVPCQKLRQARAEQAQQQQLRRASVASSALSPAVLPAVLPALPRLAEGSAWPVTVSAPLARAEAPPTPPPRLS